MTLCSPADVVDFAVVTAPCLTPDAATAVAVAVAIAMAESSASVLAVAVTAAVASPSAKAGTPRPKRCPRSSASEDNEDAAKDAVRMARW